MFGDMTALEGLHVRNNELPFPGSLISTILAGAVLPVRHGYRAAPPRPAAVTGGEGMGR